MAQKTDNQKLAIMIATALAIGAIGSVATSIPALGRKHADLAVPEDYASAPKEFVENFRDVRADSLLHREVAPHAVVALGAEEALADRGASFGPDHERIVDKLQDMVLEVSMNASPEEIAIIQALRAQGESMSHATQLTGEQFDAWAVEIADFDTKGLAQIEAVAADLAEAGLPRNWSVHYSYDVAREPELADDLLFEALEMGQIDGGQLAGPLMLAHEKLEDGVMASLDRIAAGARGEFDSHLERSASIAFD